jgi:hypothetical protein
MEGKHMTQNAPEQANEITQDDVDSAEQAEQAALNAAQNKYLLQRVVVLRAQLIKAQARVSELEALLPAPQDEPANAPTEIPSETE